MQPLSATSPCIVRFDPTTITLSPASDYYLTVYYTNDSNNQNIGAANANYSQTSLERATPAEMKPISPWVSPFPVEPVTTRYSSCTS